MMPPNPSRCAVVTGAGSGIGRSVALSLAKNNWRVALVGRKQGALAATVNMADPGAPIGAFPCDVCDQSSVTAMASGVKTVFGPVHALVNAAGVNVPQRSLTVLSNADFQRIVQTNLYGAYFCLQAFLPDMRAAGEGTIVNISSEAGKQASAKSGAAYTISKFGLSGLTQSINAEERGNGIRACCIFPGDVATPLLDQRPMPPSAEARRQMLDPDDVAACVLLALALPGRAVIEELVIRPRHVPIPVSMSTSSATTLQVENSPWLFP